MSWKNDTGANQTYTYSYTTGLTVTQGSEVNSRFSLGASLKGVGITVDHSEKVFKSSGTTESRTVTTHDERKCIASLTRHILPEEVQVQEIDVLHSRRLGTRVEHG